jgi:glycosyltransferase involved in cell wall biosynthesis
LKANGISVVIPAYNEEKYLASTLASIQRSISHLAARHSVPCEIIVVDNVSTDQTAALTKKLGARSLRHEVRNISSVRNAGIREAKYELIVAIDADCEMPEAGLLKIYEFMALGTHVGGGLGLRVKSERALIRMAARAIQTFVVFVAGIEGAVFFFWKEDALAIGGFDETRLVAEDSTFSIALRKHGRTKNKKFALLKSVTITTLERKDTTLTMLAVEAVKLLKVFFGVKMTAKDFPYWYEPKR